MHLRNFKIILLRPVASHPCEDLPTAVGDQAELAVHEQRREAHGEAAEAAFGGFLARLSVY